MATQRLSISFDDVATAALHEIKKVTNITAVADVVRLALTVLQALLSAEKRGFQFVMRSHDGRQQYLYSLSRPTEMVELPDEPRSLPPVINLHQSAERRRASRARAGA